MPTTQEERTQILQGVKQLVLEKHVNVANPNQNYESWASLVDDESPRLVAEDDDAAFERGIQDLLRALGGSHTAFFRSDGADVPSPHAIHATLKSIETDAGPQWMFWDVMEEGVAERAGIRRGELLVGVDSNPIVPPKTAVFRIGGTHNLTIGSLIGEPERSVTIKIPNRPAKDRPPMVEPKSVSHRVIATGVGYIRVASFPGAIGQQFARDLDVVIADLKNSRCDRLIFDVRGNMGGGLGSLRLMSYLCPGKIPIGYSVTRVKLRSGYRREALPSISSIPSSKLGLLGMAVRFKIFNKDRSLALVTEGLGEQAFHGRVVILQNEFTHSAAEMVTSFAAENGLATVVGTRSAGEVLGGANFALPSGYRLRIPIAGWLTWAGTSIEGSGVEPQLSVSLAPDRLALGDDAQLDVAYRCNLPRP